MNEQFNDAFRVGAYTVRPDLGEISGPDGSTHVEPKVMDLLLALARRAGSVISREELLQTVWGEVVVTEDALTAAISKLRRALSDDSRTAIVTIPKRGYRLAVPVETKILGATVEATQRDASTPRRLIGTPVWVAAVVIAAVALALTLRLTPSPREAPTSPPRPVTSLPGIESGAAPEPDGSRVVFTRVEGDYAHLFVTDGESPPHPLTEGHVFDHSPAWSPDGARIAFLRSRSGANGAYAISATGGAPEPIVSIAGRLAPGLDWSPDGSRLVYASQVDDRTVLHVVDLEARVSRTVTTPPPGIWGDRYPRFSPDGDDIAFIRATTFGVSEIHVIPANGGKDDSALRVDGMIDGVDWLDRGRLVFASNHVGPWALHELRVGGNDCYPLGGPGLQGRFPSVSNDGHRLIYTRHRSRSDIWRVRIGGDLDSWRDDTPLISSSFWDSTPQFSPDGRRVAWSSNRSGRVEVWVAEADGTHARKVTALSSAYSSAPRWSPDGLTLAFDTRVAGRAQVFVVHLSDGSSRPVGNPDADNMLPTWSLDGRHLYFNERHGEKRSLVRCRLDGGAPVPVASGKALLAAEPESGVLFYVDANDGATVMRGEPDGSVASSLKLAPNRWGNWEAFGDAVYYVADLEDGGVGIVRRAWDSDEEIPVARCGGELENLALDVSADQRWLLVARVTEDESDVMELTLP